MRRFAGVVVLTAALGACSLGGCSVAPGPAPAAPPPPPPPAPPAACVLDTGALAAATGLAWAPDASTASDSRCVYDPTGAPRPADGPVFLSVDVTQDPQATIDTVAALCDRGSRAPAGTGGFVCRYQGGNVFAAVPHDGRLLTLSASAVPTGTTAAQLVVAFDQQVTALG